MFHSHQSNAWAICAKSKIQLFSFYQISINECLLFVIPNRNTAMVEKIIPFILMKTQHHYSNIREFAMKTLAALILEDYLKFRGNLLVYILAGILDPEREIKELAVELIMKYTLEKSDIFLRTCLLECPFVFNGVPCFGQGTLGLTRSGNILRGSAKRENRQYIYLYLIKKIEPVYLYMHFGYISRMLEFVKRDSKVADTVDYQSAIADFFFICSEICIANEKQKKNLEKIVKENHDGDGIAVNDDDLPMNGTTADKGADGGENEKRGRGGKKNVPTLTQSLSTVEKIVPLIASIDEIIRPMNPEMFASVLDRLCVNMCTHFESLIEYAQPQKYWSKYLAEVKKVQSVANTAKQTQKKSAAKATKQMQPPPVPGVQQPETSRARGDRENDSGHFTLEDNEVDEVLSKRNGSTASKRSESRASKRSASKISERSVSRMSNRSAMSRNKKRLESVQSGDESDDSAAFSELSFGSAMTNKRRKTQKEPNRARHKKSPPRTPSITPSSRRSLTR